MTEAINKAGSTKIDVNAFGVSSALLFWLVNEVLDPSCTSSHAAVDTSPCSLAAFYSSTGFVRFIAARRYFPPAPVRGLPGKCRYRPVDNQERGQCSFGGYGEDTRCCAFPECEILAAKDQPFPVVHSAALLVKAYYLLLGEEGMPQVQPATGATAKHPCVASVVGRGGHATRAA